VIRQSDAAVATDAIIEVVIAHIRRDLSMPARSHAAWWRAFAGARRDIEVEIGELIEERLDETIAAMADELDHREIATVEEALLHQCLAAIEALDKLDEIGAVGKQAKATRAEATKAIRLVVATLHKIKAKGKGDRS
jgi:hypothetical protein